jgi:arylformamidase
MNVRYATHTKSDPKLNMLNVYMPKKGSNSPMVVWVHGGSVGSGEKDNVLNKAEYFTARGYVFVSINYRTSPDVKHPVNVQDVADAVAWLHENARHYSADSEKIFLIGHSVGAHLAALVSVDQNIWKSQGKTCQFLMALCCLTEPGMTFPSL